MKKLLSKTLNLAKQNLNIILVALILTLIAITTFWYNFNLLPVNKNAKIPVNFTINPGESAKTISKHLQDTGLIKNARIFMIYIILHGQNSKLQSGFYLLNAHDSAREIASLLASGKADQKKLLIPEGTSESQVKQLLITKGFNEAEVNAALRAKYDYYFLQDRPSGASLEGYLFPDTYRINPGMTAKDLVKMILDNFNRKVTSKIIQGFADQGLTLHQGLTLASIVEREAAGNQDRSQIAQVFLKRLKEKIKLESCITVFYAAYLLGRNDFNIDIDSPYNTYKIDGLPPGPVANPGLDSMNAVINPSRTNYLYFHADPSGNTHFATTLAQHQANIAKYGKSTYTKPYNSY